MDTEWILADAGPYDEKLTDIESRYFSEEENDIFVRGYLMDDREGTRGICVDERNWKRTPSMKYLLYGFSGAAIVGILGFVGGFVGPLIFAPSSNQGPLLGIFITGPLGLVVGLIGGLIYAATRPKE